MVPAYNEAARLPLTLPKMAQFCEHHGSVEILIVDDGSKDSTAAVVQEFAAQHRFARLLQNPGNRGKGYSVRHGMQEAQGDWILSTDADLSSPLEEVNKLLNIHLKELSQSNSAKDSKKAFADVERQEKLLGFVKGYLIA